ncbi:MAG: hypothetical protein JOZ24_03550 [Candidatus Eremiobacteraeota bacterium]|nr:hypothetical protein [Candidatus Eremiobacteraeota bacterium]
MIRPQRAAASYPLTEGVRALPGGFAFLERSRVLVCADAHLGYEDVIGGGAALPLWSTHEIASAIALAARRSEAREIVLLGDAIHAAALSGGATAIVGHALAALRGIAPVVAIAGNHEGRTRGTRVLGETVERCERDGWLLVHGDRPPTNPTRTMIGHLHPALRLAGGTSVPAFLAAAGLVIVPALTPYSTGLDIAGDAALDALAPWGAAARDLHVVAVTAERVYPFGSLASLRRLLGAPPRPAPAPFVRRRRLAPD